MSLKTKIKNAVSFLLHGAPKKTFVNISLLQPTQQLQGKKIVITGGGRGLGYAMAKKFIAEGAEVLIAGRSEKTLQHSAQKLGCSYLVLDVQKTNTFPHFIAEASRLMGGLNALVNNAGISLHEGGFLAVSPEQFDAQFDTNLKGAFFLTQCFVKYCQQQHTEDTKNVLFVSSETSTTVDERPYGLTKAAMNSLVQGLAYRYVNEGFRINAVAPGVTVSEMVGVRADGDLTCDYNVTGRFYMPEEVAEVASFLLSDASNCLNGQILVCNEGKTINARWK